MTILKTIDGNAIQSARQTISRRPFNGQKRKNFEQVSLHTWGILIFIAWIIVLPINGWAQHNRIVYVVSEREIIGVREIYTLVTDGTNRKRLTNNDVLDLDPVWSPDEKKSLSSPGWKVVLAVPPISLSWMRMGKTSSISPKVLV